MHIKRCQLNPLHEGLIMQRNGKWEVFPNAKCQVKLCTFCSTPNILDYSYKDPRRIPLTT